MNQVNQSEGKNMKESITYGSRNPFNESGQSIITPPDPSFQKRKTNGVVIPSMNQVNQSRKDKA